MANIKSKEKRLKQNKKRALSNKSFKSKMKTSIKLAESSRLEKDVNDAVRLVDSAVSKKIIKKGNGSKLKSKLHKIEVVKESPKKPAPKKVEVKKTETKKEEVKKTETKKEETKKEETK
ncbi:MAG: 30S ribosomal protein S20 [Mycoplasmataceae bacterium]|nr:30S ribosomal protein S20 [Mycoplasmataceae bacterium]